MVSAFTEVERKVLQPLLSDNEGVIGADDLLPMTIFVTIKAKCALYRELECALLSCVYVPVFHSLGLFYITCMILHLTIMKQVETIL